MNAPDLRDPKTNAVELTLAVVATLYGERCQTVDASKLAKWHLDMAEALLVQKTLPDPTNTADVWHLTERLVESHYRAISLDVDGETVRVAAVLQMDFVRKCIELLGEWRCAGSAE